MINNHSAAHWEQQPLLRIPNPSPGIPGIPSMFLGKDSRRLLFGADTVWLCHRRSFGVKKVVFLGVWNFMKNLQNDGKGHGQMGYSQLLRCWTLEVGISGISVWILLIFFGVTSCHICIYGESVVKSQLLWLCPNLSLVDTECRTATGNILLVVFKSPYLQTPYHSICSKTQRSPMEKKRGGLAPLGRPPAKRRSWGHHLHSPLDFDVDWLGNSWGWNFFVGSGSDTTIYLVWI